MSPSAILGWLSTMPWVWLALVCVLRWRLPLWSLAPIVALLLGLRVVRRWREALSEITAFDGESWLTRISRACVFAASAWLSSPDHPFLFVSSVLGAISPALFAIQHIVRRLRATV